MASATDWMFWSGEHCFRSREAVVLNASRCWLNVGDAAVDDFQLLLSRRNGKRLLIVLSDDEALRLENDLRVLRESKERGS